MTEENRVQVLLGGDATVGKSCILSRFLKGSFDGLQTTHGQKHTKTILINGSELFLDYQEQRLDRETLKNSQYDGYVLVYSVTSTESFKLIELALEQISNIAQIKYTPIVVAAAKIDCTADRCVDVSDGEDLARRYSVPVTELSSKSNEKVDTLMEGFVREYLKKKRRREKQMAVLAKAEQARAQQKAEQEALAEKKAAAPAQPSVSHRCLVSREIRDTERAYIEQLSTAIQVFLVPLREILADKKEKTIVTDAQLGDIFYNIEDIHKAQLAFLAALTSRLDNYEDSTTRLGDVFLRHLPALRRHIDYVKHHHKAIITVNDLENRRKDYVNFCEQQKLAHNCPLGLMALLITPVQRIPRYRLLLKELIKRTDETHPDLADLTKAMDEVSKVAGEVNEAVREQENFQKVVDIQKAFEGNVKSIVAEGRLYVRDGSLMKVCKKIPKPRHFFLFSDAIVYAEETGDNSYVLRRLMMLAETDVKDVPDSGTQANAFQLLGGDKSFAVICSSPQEKQEWLDDLRARVGGKNRGHDEVAPVWTPDMDTSHCQQCEGRFTMVNRRHHCRKCGACVCGKCSSHKAKLSFTDKKVRVCLSCWEDIQETAAREARLAARYANNNNNNNDDGPASNKEHRRLVSDLSKVLTSGQRKDSLPARVQRTGSMPLRTPNGQQAPAPLRQANAVPRPPIGRRPGLQHSQSARTPGGRTALLSSAPAALANKNNNNNNANNNNGNANSGPNNGPSRLQRAVSARPVRGGLSSTLPRSLSHTSSSLPSPSPPRTAGSMRGPRPVPPSRKHASMYETSSEPLQGAPSPPTKQRSAPQPVARRPRRGALPIPARRNGSALVDSTPPPATNTNPSNANDSNSTDANVATTNNTDSSPASEPAVPAEPTQTELVVPIELPPDPWADEPKTPREAIPPLPQEPSEPNAPAPIDEPLPPLPSDEQEEKKDKAVRKGSTSKSSSKRDKKKRREGPPPVPSSLPPGSTKPPPVPTSAPPGS